MSDSSRTRLDDGDPVDFQLRSFPVDLGGGDREGSRTFGVRSIELVFTRSVVDGEVTER